MSSYVTGDKLHAFKDKVSPEGLAFASTFSSNHSFCPRTSRTQTHAVNMAYALGASSLKRAIEIVDLTDDSKFTKTKPRIQYEEGEKDIPRFTIETDNDEDEDNRVDFIRHLSETPFDLEDLQTRLAHRAASAPLPRDYEIINSATSNTGCNVRAGKTVELASEFLRVKQLIRDRNGEIHMRGILLYRVRKVLNMLPKKCNELCAIIKARADGKNPNIDDHLSTRPISDMISTRDVTFTNQLFPILSFREKDRGYNSWADVEEIAELVCRWKYIEHCDMVLRRVPIQSLLRLRQHECDVGKGVSDVPLMLAWLRGFPECASKKEKATIAPPVSMHVERANSKRGKKRNLTEVDQTNHDSHVEEVTATFNQTIKRRNRFGTYEKRKSSVVTERFTSLSGRPYTQLVNRHSTSTPEMSLPTRSVHTFGDICAGAGGATRAASQAGLAINIVLDHDPDACATQRKNFPSAKTLKMSIFEFLSPEFKLKSYMRVTVLHISFPCQIYSTAHTCDGKNDPANEAVGYAAINLLMKIRPRVATLEQTSNIVNGHTASFQALVHQLTYVGYSVRWKIVSFDETGNAHARMRLFMIASW